MEVKELWQLYLLLHRGCVGECVLDAVRLFCESSVGEIGR